MKKKTVIVLVLILSLLFPLYAGNEVEDTITLVIDGEKYEREYPDTIGEYKEFVDGLVEMYNSLSLSYSEYRSNDTSSADKLTKKLSELRLENDVLKFKLDSLEDEFSSYKKDVNNILKTNSKMSVMFCLGPSVAKDLSVGTFADIVFDYRILRNLHFGLTTGLSVYNNTDKLEGRFGILVGYSYN
jgi:hypothetical protein